MHGFHDPKFLTTYVQRNNGLTLSSLSYQAAADVPCAVDGHKRCDDGWASMAKPLVNPYICRKLCSV